MMQVGVCGCVVRNNNNFCVYTALFPIFGNKWNRVKTMKGTCFFFKKKEKKVFCDWVSSTLLLEMCTKVYRLFFWHNLFTNGFIEM